MKYSAWICAKDAGESDCCGRWFYFPLEENWIRTVLNIPDNQSYEIKDWTLPDDLPSGVQVKEANLIYGRIIKYMERSPAGGASAQGIRWIYAERWRN